MEGKDMLEQNTGGSKPPVESRRPGVHKLETQLLPPERFKGEQTGEVVDIKKLVKKLLF